MRYFNSLVFWLCREDIVSCSGRGGLSLTYLLNNVSSIARVGTETVARSMEKESSAPPDLCENYVMLGDVLRTQDPCEKQHHSGLLSAGRKYYALMVELMTKVHELAAMAFDKPKDFFVDYYTPPDISLRLSHYPALSGIPEIQPGQIRYGKVSEGSVSWLVVSA